MPEDRKQLALILRMSVLENIVLSQTEANARLGVLDHSAEQRLAEMFVDRLDIRMSSLEEEALNLSGGNQQKVVLARWLAMRPRVLIVDEPTRGIDVGAKAEIYRLLRQMARDGLAILLISSEMTEILSLSDRILVRAPAAWWRSSAPPRPPRRRSPPSRSGSSVGPDRRLALLGRLRLETVWLVLLALVALMALLSDSFLTSTNVTNILRQVTIVGLVAIGMAVVLIGGNFDLSTGATVTLAAVVSILMQPTTPLSTGLAILVPLYSASRSGRRMA